MSRATGNPKNQPTIPPCIKAAPTLEVRSELANMLHSTVLNSDGSSNSSNSSSSSRSSSSSSSKSITIPHGFGIEIEMAMLVGQIPPVPVFFNRYMVLRGIKNKYGTVYMPKEIAAQYKLLREFMQEYFDYV